MARGGGEGISVYHRYGLGKQGLVYLGDDWVFMNHGCALMDRSNHSSLAELYFSYYEISYLTVVLDINVNAVFSLSNLWLYA